mmetsp:Transcript_49616/g.153224  ORF Transcript_49616/g.153224 Transcript_49616/m.153224 type:complete len:271 (-) Transcript_49616:1170-1982(-)
MSVDRAHRLLEGKQSHVSFQSRSRRDLRCARRLTVVARGEGRVRHGAFREACRSAKGQRRLRVKAAAANQAFRFGDSSVAALCNSWRRGSLVGALFDGTGAFEGHVRCSFVTDSRFRSPPLRQLRQLMRHFAVEVVSRNVDGLQVSAKKRNRERAAQTIVRNVQDAKFPERPNFMRHGARDRVHVKLQIREGVEVRATEEVNWQGALQVVATKIHTHDIPTRVATNAVKVASVGASPARSVVPLVALSVVVESLQPSCCGQLRRNDQCVR